MVTLLSDYEVCKEGDVLTPEQARILVSPAPPAACGLWQEGLQTLLTTLRLLAFVSMVSCRSCLGMRWLNSK